MSFDLVKNAGLGALLAILLFVVFLAHQQSRRSIEASRVVVEHYVPVQALLEEVDRRLHRANEAFRSYHRRQRIGPQQVTDPLLRLEEVLRELEQRRPPRDSGIESVMKALRDARVSFESYLAAENGSPKDDGGSDLEELPRRALGEVRKQLGSLAASLRGDTGQQNGQVLRTCANLLRMAEANFRAYDERVRVGIQDVIAPVDEALARLSQLKRHTVTKRAAESLDKLLVHLSRYKAGVLNYKDDESYDTRASPLETLRRLETVISEVWRDAENALTELNETLRREIREGQTAAIFATERGERLFLSLAGAGVLLSLCVSVILSRNLSTRIRTLVEGTRRFAKGDLGFRLDWRTRDQLGQLAEAFDRMADGLVERERELARLATAVEQTADAIVITDPEGVIQYTNSSFERLTGYRNEEVVGRKTSVLKRAENEAFYRELLETINRGEVWTGRIKNRRKNGDQYESDYTISPVTDASGKIAHFVAVKRDVTREAQLEEKLRQVQKMQALGTLAGGIAHDFNNLLVPIVVYGGMLLDAAPEGSASHRRILKIVKAGERAQSLVKQILDFSRPRTEERISLDISLLVKEVLKLTRPSLPAAIEIVTRIEPNVAPVLADPIQIHQVLMNLVTNAIQAIGDGVGIVEVSLENKILDESTSMRHPELDGRACLCLEVRDTGCGMTAEVAERVFEPFFTTKGVGGGTGLGLAVAHGIVKSHGGVIAVNSAPGQGTRFRVYLPATNESPKRPQSTDETVVGGEGAGRVLIVDDETFVVDAWREVLEESGYSVVGVTGGVQALELLRANPSRFDLVVTDQTMPDMLGTALAGEILELRPDMPIVLCTGFSADVDAQTVGSIGIRELLVKPVKAAELLAVVRRVLGADGAQVKPGVSRDQWVEEETRWLAS